MVFALRGTRRERVRGSWDREHGGFRWLGLRGEGPRRAVIPVEPRGLAHRVAADAVDQYVHVSN